MESRDSRPSASQPQQNEAMTHSRSPYSNDAVSRQTPHGYLSGQFSTERLDPLSVLALAGRMVDQEYPESLNAKKPYNGGS